VRSIETLRTRVVPLFILTLVSCSPPMSRPAPDAGAERFNGTWSAKSGEFKLWALDPQRLQTEFNGDYEYQTPTGPMVNVGTGAGVASVTSDTATFRPEEADEDCVITLRLAGERLEASEKGACGFGLNVTATGTYDRISSARPEFDGN
jgi:hypothetical protein